VTTVDGDNGRFFGTATILGGTGDWAGARGKYTAEGFTDGGVGEGSYHGTWTRPRHPKGFSVRTCVNR
jgi:hypothetical protein